MKIFYSSHKLSSNICVFLSGVVRITSSYDFNSFSLFVLVICFGGIRLDLLRSPSCAKLSNCTYRTTQWSIEYFFKGILLLMSIEEKKNFCVTCLFHGNSFFPMIIFFINFDTLLFNCNMQNIMMFAVLLLKLTIR